MAEFSAPTPNFPQALMAACTSAAPLDPRCSIEVVTTLQTFHSCFAASVLSRGALGGVVVGGARCADVVAAGEMV